MRALGAVLITSMLIFAAACSNQADPSDDPSPIDEVPAAVTDGHVRFLVPQDWHETAVDSDDWSVEGWSQKWHADPAEPEAGILLVNGNYGEDGAAMAIARLVSDTYFGAFPGFIPDGEEWIEPEVEGGSRVRLVDFHYENEINGTGKGVIWAIEDADFNTGVVMMRGTEIDADLITEIRDSIEFVDS